MYTDELTTMRRDQSQEQGQQRVEYWRWRIFDEFAIESLGAAPPTWPNELSPHRQTVRPD
jgi:hypothetical protein